jgi:hypothetical protein
MSTKFIEIYKRQRDMLKQRFEDEKTGDQTQFTDQSKLFKPLIETQEKTSKAIQDKIVTSQEATSNALVPIARDLHKRIEQMESLQDLPFYNIQPGIEDVPQSTPKKDIDIIDIDLDKGLNDTHRENLLLLELDLPSEVWKKGNIEETLNKITSKKRSLGQAGRDDRGVKKSLAEKLMIESQKETLKFYKKLILGLKEAEIFTKKSGEGMRKPKPFKLKRGRGRPKTYPDTIMYNNSKDLFNKLFELVSAKKAGNTGLDNTIVSALDELFNKKWISKDDYDNLFKSFSI